MIEGVTTAQESYLPINLYTLRVDSLLDFNLYLHVNNEFVLFRDFSLPFTENTREELLERGVSRLYVAQVDRRLYQRYIESHLGEIINDRLLDETAKATIVYDSARSLVRDLMEKPTLPENMHRSLALVESTALHLLKTQSAFYEMLKAMSFHYSVYTHSVNVCVFALGLANRIGISDKEKLHNLGTGALLHDIGKARVPVEILQKKGPLDESEMNIIRRHPQYGFEMVISSAIIPYDAHYPILQHHEREDGSGYPHRLTANDTHLYGKIAAIADVFDAMTTQRIYREAKEAFPALKEMYAIAPTFDRRLLEEFTQLLGPEAAE